MIHAINRAVKRIRYALAKKINLRIVPELKFIYDETSTKGFKITSLINEALKRPKEED